VNFLFMFEDALLQVRGDADVELAEAVGEDIDVCVFVHGSSGGTCVGKNKQRQEQEQLQEQLQGSFTSFRMTGFLGG
jgi:hypothetical protein